MRAAPVAGASLGAAFAARGAARLPGLIPYVTAGFPSLGDTPELLLACQAAGALAAEVGVPFSDPIADGPTIQASGALALANGMTPALAVDQVRQARDRGVTIPLALMIYVNLVLAHGVDALAADASAAGADALILPDLPHGEAHEIREAAAAHSLALIPLVAPTTSTQRIGLACEGASGFVYCVSLRGTTGARASLSDDAVALLDRVREVTPLPRALGFGISRREHLEQVAGHAEAVVVGSALIDAVGAEAARPAAAAERFLRGLSGQAA